MPNIPSYDVPQVAPAGPGRGGILSGAGGSPEAFGSQVGQAEQGLGRAIEGAGDQLSAAALAMQNDINETETNEAVTNYLVKQGELTEKFKQLQGRDPQGAMNQYTSDLKNLRETMRSGLGNPAVVKAFDRETTRQFGYSIMNASSYSAQQFKVYQTGQNNAVVQAQVSAASAASNELAFKGSLDLIADKVRSNNKGWSEEQIQGEIRTQQGKAWQNRLQDMATNDPTAARKLLNANRKDIDGLVAQNIENYVDQQDVRVSSGRIANAVIGGGPTDTVAQKIDYGLSYLTSKYGKAAAAAIMGTAQDAESGLDPRAKNASGHEGLIQWDAVDRFPALKAFADKIGADPYDFKTQIKFIDHELSGKYKDVGDRLKATNDPVEAAKIVTGRYVRPEGAKGTEDVSQVPDFGRRAAGASRLYGVQVQPIQALSLDPGNRGALESEARRQVAQYAAENKLDQRTTEDLEKSTLSRLDGSYAKAQATRRDADAGGKAQLTQYVMNGPDGKNPVTSIDQVMGPSAPAEMQRSFLQLDPAAQQSVRAMIDRNSAAANNPTVPTEQTRARRQELEGMLRNRPDEFLKVDPFKEKLTRADLTWLAGQQSSLIGNRAHADEKATDTSRAVTILDRAQITNVNGLRPEDRKRDPKAFERFTGALAQSLDEYNLRNNGKQPSEDEVKKMAKDLLVEQVTSKGYIWDTKQPTYEVKTFNNAPRYSDIPDAERSKITDAYREKYKVNPSPQQIRQIYQNFQRRGPQANAQ